MEALKLIARIADQQVAISADTVESVVEVEAITPVPLAAPHIAGLAALRSRVLTIIDSYAALDGFCDEAGNVNPDLPRSRLDVTFTDANERTLVTTVVQYNAAEDVQKVIDMGLKDGLTSTLERLDELLLDMAAQAQRA